MTDEFGPPAFNCDAGRKPSRWRWARRAAASIGISLVIYFACQLGMREWTKRDGERELATARADLERDDPDWTWERLNAARPHPPAGKNGADLVPQIRALTRPTWDKARSEPGWGTASNSEPNRQLPPELLTVLRRELTESANAVALARTMKDRPWGRRDIVLLPDVLNTLLEDTQNTRHVADLLSWDIAVALEDGDVRKATDGLFALLNTSRSIGDEPMLISQLVRIAVRSAALQSVERVLGNRTDAPQLAALQSALAADAEEPLLLYGTRGDRAVFDRLFENLLNGTTTPGRGIDSGFNDLQGRLGWWHYRPNLLSDRAFALAWMTWCVNAAKRPVEEQQAVFAHLTVPPDDRTRVLSRLLLPAVDKVAHAHWRSTAEARCAVAGLACERFRQARTRWPEGLAELAPEFLPAVPLDPYNGEPLRFVKLEHGAVVYSVGPDGTDAGGTLAQLNAPPATLLRFRLWNPDQRRLPAPQPPAQEQP